ncbi:ABC transporter ATP-binding protein [Paenibacillus donghaensis]|uniref:Carnitine transport ATP-binding protein OpuCA n=1 Tax=Paenibacillus donghaensis TaxID=414771 RepID=A0A2Z2KH30_9BACL|nr:ABC transporter ATP-binding protein [Paenibacillus donghaensis]ASA22480.1 ABC transporter ATP-binding protein [Paenibacillus donghaensis]
MEQDIQLSISGLQKTYKTGDGVRDINLDIRKGELITLLGPSGCGKTTVLRTIGGFLSPDAGEVKIENQSILHLPPEKRPTAMVFQSYNLWPHMTVYDNLAFGLKLRKTGKQQIREKVESALKLVRLPGMENKYPSQLSGGQQQRVAVARALLLEPKVLLLDEPFSALDAKLRMEMREELREIQAAGNLTMVFVTHDQEEALSISDRIVVMNSGRIEQVASPQDIYDQPSTLFVAQFIGRMNFLKGQAAGDGIRVHSFRFGNEKGLAGEVTVAVRPEDIVMHDGLAEGMSGTIKQVMVLGHYAEVSIETPAGMTKVFLPREEARGLTSGGAVTIGITRATAYPQSS